MRINYIVIPDQRMIWRATRLFYRRRITTVRIIGSLFFLVGLYALASRSPGWGGLGVVLVIGGLLLFFELDAVYWFRARKENQRGPRQAETVLDDEGIHTTDSGSSINVSWSAIDRVVENKEFWIVSRGIGIVKIIPKAKLAPAEQAEFSKFIRQHDALPGCSALA